jgi:hypothetical protein
MDGLADRIILRFDDLLVNDNYSFPPATIISFQ